MGAASNVSNGTYALHTAEATSGLEDGGCLLGDPGPRQSGGMSELDADGVTLQVALLGCQIDA